MSLLKTLLPAAMASLLLLSACGRGSGAGKGLPPPTESPAKPSAPAPGANPSDPLAVFYASLLRGERIVPDTSWYREVEPGDRRPEDDEGIFRPRMWDGDTERQPDAEFPFADLNMRYCAGKPHDYFLIRGQRIPETVHSSDNRFWTSSIRRFRYRGGSYLVFNGSLSDYNGYGDRINFNYFFDLSRREVVADMYKNYWGFIYHPFLYGELNSDSLLDRVRFDGQSYPAGFGLPDSLAQTARDTITVTAETYRNRKWQPLLDKGSKPYFIQLLIDANDSVVLGEQHWLRPVKWNR